MATKIFCDGCDADITDSGGDTRLGLRVSTSTIGSISGSTLGQFAIGPFDLCGACILRFKEDINPKTWVRASDRPTFASHRV